MAYVKSMRVLYVKGVDDPFTMTRMVRESFSRTREREQFDAEHKKVTSYLELIALCEKYVILDATKSPDESTVYRDLYDDKIVPWRQRVWDTAYMLLNDAKVTKTWNVMVSEHHQEVALHLSHKTASGVYSPSVQLEAGRHSFSPSMVKIRTYPGLAMNLSLDKAIPSKIATKLLEHAEKMLERIKARTVRDLDEKTKREKGHRIVKMIEEQYDIPRYYEGSRELELRTEGIKLEVVPSEYGYAVVTVTLSIGDEPDAVHSDRLTGIIDLVKAVKVKNEMAKKKAVTTAKN